MGLTDSDTVRSYWVHSSASKSVSWCLWGVPGGEGGGGESGDEDILLPPPPGCEGGESQVQQICNEGPAGGFAEQGSDVSASEQRRGGESSGTPSTSSNPPAKSADTSLQGKLKRAVSRGGMLQALRGSFSKGKHSKDKR